MARKKNNTNQKNEPLKPPDITDPLFPYGPKNKHLQGVLGIRKDAKHRKDIIQTPVTLEEDKYLQEINETIEEIVSATLILEQSSEDGKIEAGSRYDSPLGIAILGAPASGKSYLTKKIATSLKDPRIARAQQAGKKYEIDYMRNQFRSLDKRKQLIMIFDAYFFFREAMTVEPEIYLEYLKESVNDIVKYVAPHLAKHGIKVTKLITNMTLQLDQRHLDVSNKPIKDAINKLSQEQVEDIYSKLDAYHAFRIPTRFYQYISIGRNLQQKKDIVFDETGKEFKRQISVMRDLHKKLYVTDVILFHAKNVVVNLILSAKRVATGDDGEGRDAGSSIVDSYREINRGLANYIENSERVVKLNKKDLDTSSELSDELNAANVEDDEERGDKPIDVLSIVDLGTPKEVYEETLRSIDSSRKDIFKAFLKSYAYTLKLAPTVKKTIKSLVDMSDEMMIRKLRAAVDSGGFDFGVFAGLGKTRGDILLNKLESELNLNKEKEEVEEPVNTIQPDTNLTPITEAYLLSEAPHVFYDDFPELRIFDPSGSGVLDFSLELLPPKLFQKYRRGFNFFYKNKRYYVSTKRSVIEPFDPTRNTWKKPNFVEWQKYLNIRERDVEEFMKLVNLKRRARKIKINIKESKRSNKTIINEGFVDTIKYSRSENKCSWYDARISRFSSRCGYRIK